MELDSNLCALHRQRILSFLAGAELYSWKIIDTCRLANNGVLPLPAIPEGLAPTLKSELGIAAFVPAAGAASRFYQPFQRLRQDLASAKEPRQVLQSFVASFSAKPLPKDLADLLQNFKNSRIQDLSIEQIFQQLMPILDAVVELPKALYPCTKDGKSFLALKQQEHRKLLLQAEIYVAPIGDSAQFRQALTEDALPSLVFEQDEGMCTYRYDQQGEILQDAEGKPSIVSAGHGMLSRLFPAIRKKLPNIHSLFIRNIDNIAGVATEVHELADKFLRGYDWLYTAMVAIRQDLEQGHWEHAEVTARRAWDFLLPLQINSHSSYLLGLQKELFHTPDNLLAEDQAAGSFPDAKHLTQLKACFARPLCWSAQVPNTGQDRGGIPVWAENDGKVRKICLEGPHISTSDSQLWFEVRAAVTHFNPVFVVVEIQQDPNYYLASGEAPWLVAEKSYRGKTAYYHETVLYELIANAALCNLVFVEMPRSVFLPIKMLGDFSDR